MWIDAERIMTTLRIAPGDEVYIVICGVSGVGLRIGDPVMMREVGTDNVLVRTTDLTVHRLSNDGEYVLVVPQSAVKADKANLPPWVHPAP